MEASKPSSNNSIWGIVLIGLGVLFLVNQIFPFITDLIWAAAFFAGGLAIYNAYTRQRDRWWMLIPAYAMSVIGGIIVLDTLLPNADDLVGAFVMFAIAFPFFYVYLNNKNHWWALIPAGINAFIGLGLLLSALSALLPVVLILAGVYLLARYMGNRKGSQPLTGPEADKPKRSFRPIEVEIKNSDN